MSAPLESLRIIDFGRVLAGPHCTKALRDLGADVIKIEPPAGDIGRVALPHIGDIGLYFVQQNAGKRSACRSSADVRFRPAEFPRLSGPARMSRRASRPSSTFFLPHQTKPKEFL